VQSLIRKEALKSDPEAQALEDVVALVFFESYLGDFVSAHDKYDGAKFADILTKTAKKMSARGREAARRQAATLARPRSSRRDGAWPPALGGRSPRPNTQSGSRHHCKVARGVGAGATFLVRKRSGRATDRGCTRWST
jgi:hypothetical protein